MERRPRICYSVSQKARMWDRWQKGDSLQQIAQLFDRNHSSIERILAETGGMRPDQRRRSRLALTLAELTQSSRRSTCTPPWPTKNLPEFMGGDTTTLLAIIRGYLFVSLF
jgi:hypothetical protein